MSPFSENILLFSSPLASHLSTIPQWGGTKMQGKDTGRERQTWMQFKGFGMCPGNKDEQKVENDNKTHEDIATN